MKLKNTNMFCEKHFPLCLAQRCWCGSDAEDKDCDGRDYSKNVDYYHVINMMMKILIQMMMMTVIFIMMTIRRRIDVTIITIKMLVMTKMEIMMVIMMVMMVIPFEKGFYV